MRTLIFLALLPAALLPAQTRDSLSDALSQAVNEAAQRLVRSPRTTFQLRRTTTDEAGTVHARFEQRYTGLRVPGGEVIAHVPVRSSERTLTGRVFPQIDIDPRPAVSEATARQIAGRAWGRYPEDLTGADVTAELMVQPEQDLLVSGNAENGNAHYDWRPRLYRLAWRIEASPRDSGPRVVMVDAVSGAARSWDAADYDIIQPPVPPNATARTYFFGAQGINTRFNAQTNLWELVDPTRGNSAVRNQNYSVTRKANVGALYTDTNNFWGDGKPYTYIEGPTSDNGQTAAADVAFAVRSTWDMLLNVFQRAGLNGAGKAIETRVHFGVGYGDAFWVDSEQTAFFGDGTGQGVTVTRTTQDGVGHELGHGLWFYELGPDGGAGTESDGLNEGHGDIMGSLAEMYQRTGGTGPVLPEQIASWNWRDRMVNPLNYNWDIKDSQGNVAGNSTGYRYYTPGIGKAEEHANGCLYGHFFVILARGSSADPASQLYSKFRPKGTQGVGVNKAARIWYLATTAYMPPQPTYVDVRAAYLDAAKSLYGAHSDEYDGVLEAWAAVGLSNQPKDNFSLKF